MEENGRKGGSGGGREGGQEGGKREREREGIIPINYNAYWDHLLCQPLNSMPPQLLRIPLCDQQKTHLRSSSRWCHLPRKWTLFLPQLTEYGLLCSCMNLTSLSSPSVSTPGLILYRGEKETLFSTIKPPTRRFTRQKTKNNEENICHHLGNWRK